MALTVTGFENGSIIVNTRTLTVVDHSNTASVVTGNQTEGIVISPTGLQGPSGIDAGGHYTHEQTTPDNTWTINHSLSPRPHIVTTNDAGQQIYADIDYVSDTQIIITHSVPIAGTAYLS